MTSTDEQLIKNSLLFIYVRENRVTDEKLERVKSCLDDGAEVNAADGNDGGNTVLHVAAKRGEGALTGLLLEKGANAALKNEKGQRPVDIARSFHADKDIVEMLLNAEGSKTDNFCDNDPNVNSQNSSQQNNLAIQDNNEKLSFKYLKREGTSGVCGQLYETKLLSLVLMRALNDDQIEHFLLGTNIHGTGDMDDICLRYQLKGKERPIVLFVQAKHREDRKSGRITVEGVRSVSGDFSLRKYFESYLTIKELFQINNEDPMFEGDFSEIECNLIIYTPAKDYFTKKKLEGLVSDKVHYLINTSHDTGPFQYDYDDEDIENLTKITVTERLKKLGVIFLEKILSDKSETIQVVQLMARYHVVLRKEVLRYCKIQEKNKEYHMWEIQPQFFESNCEYIKALQKSFVKELLTKRCDLSKITNEDRDNLKQVVQNPCAATISTLIGKLLTYNEKAKRLQLIEVAALKKKFKADDYTSILQMLKNNEINENVINEAAQIKLTSIKFKLPISFGNLDMTFRGSEAKVLRRIKAVAEKLIVLIEDAINKNGSIVEINEDDVGPGNRIEQGIIDNNGGIGSAVGNLLVIDPDTKMLMFELDRERLPSLANLLLQELSGKLTNEKLKICRINVNVNGFPKDSFYGDGYDKRQAKDFLHKLWFYANQAKEDEVENIIKEDINKLYCKEKDDNKLKFKIHSDAIFLRTHDEIQKWWMQPDEAAYLNQFSNFFELAKQAVIDSPLLTVLNFMYNLKIQNMGIEFNPSSVNNLLLDEITDRLHNVITDACTFSVIKIIQHYEKAESHTVIDFDYVLSLPLNDYNTMRQELRQTSINTLVLVYEKLKYYEGLCNKLKEVIELFNGNKIVIVTDSNLAEEIKEYVKDKYRSVIDDKTYLMDLTETSQMKILEESTVMFQGDEIHLKCILNSARGFVRTEILQKLINKEKCEMGHPLLDKTYEDLEHFSERTLQRDDDTYLVETLEDINNDVVVVTGRPGMGKSALLTHLSLNTKLIDPLPWIVRVNLPYYEKEFTRWQEEKLTIDIRLVVHFLCVVALKNMNPKIIVEFDYITGKVTVTHVEGNIEPIALFELELFLHLYNYGKVVFLFDDFNAICPHYQKEVLQILKLLKKEGKRMWVMTNPYKHTKTPLEKEFGNPYKLNPLRVNETMTYLDRFLRTNLKLQNLNYDQFENIRSFLKYMKKITNLKMVTDPNRDVLPFFSLLFQLLYVQATKFFQSEINRPSAATFRAKFRENFEIDLDQYSLIDDILGRDFDDNELELAGTPLHLYVAANYFKFRIEESLTFLLSEEEARNKWDLMLNTLTLYRNYIEAHIERIFQKENTDDTFVVTTFQESRKEFLDKYKKLGLFTICREKDLTKLLKPNEINEIRAMISKIQSGEDRFSFINCVVNEVPRFANLVFAEYFAVEYLTDIMKQVAENMEQNPLKNSSLWLSVLNLILFKASPSVRKVFDYKLQTDKVLMELAKTDMCKKVVLELLLKQDKRENEDREISETPITDALEDGLTNIVHLFLSSAQEKLNQGNIDDVVNLIKRSETKLMEFGKEYGEIIAHFFDAVKDMDLIKLQDLLNSGRLIEVPIRHAENYRNSETGTELHRQLVEASVQLPILMQSFQQIYQQTDDIKQALTNIVQSGARAVLNDFLEKFKPPDPNENDDDN